MKITTDLNPTTDFTRVLNSVIFDERLTHAEFRMWCMLLALPKGTRSANLSANEIAERTGLKPDICRLHRRSLKAKGFLQSKSGELVVTVPEEGFKPRESKLPPKQQQAHDLRDAWNGNKPSGYTKRRHQLSEAEIATLTMHAEHNGQKDLIVFLGAVLKGCKADSWWKDKEMSFGNVFGTGAPKQNKFTNVEKLFKLANSTKGHAALFDENDDNCWLDWYQSKGHEMTKVVRLEMEQDDAWVHQVDNAGDGTIYVYSHEGRLVHWTMKEGQHGVSYLPTAR